MFIWAHRASIGTSSSTIFFGGVGKHCFNLGVQIVSVGDIPDVVGDSFTLVFQEHLPNSFFFSTHWSSDSVFVDITIYVAFNPHFPHFR